MRKNSAVSQNNLLPQFALGVVLALLGFAFFVGHIKVLSVLAAAACIFLILRRDLSPMRTIPGLLLTAYVVVCGLSRIWAISGKFYLQEFTDVFMAFVLFLAIMLTKTFDRSAMRKLMTLMVMTACVYSILSVEAASTGILLAALLAVFPGYADASVFESGIRLTGILSNANILSTVLGIAIILSIGLLCSEENPKMRTFHAGMLAVNAFTFLLLFSMGGIASFAVAILAYLIFAGAQRGSALIRMLEGSVPTLLWVFVAFPFFGQEGAAAIVPLVALVGNVVTVILLEKLLANKLADAVTKRSKLTLGLLAGVLVLAVVYVVLGTSLSGAYTFSGDNLRRSAYPASGEHTLSVDASDKVNVTIISQDMSQVMMHTNTVIYKGSADGAVFTVPENSEVCYFTFSAKDGTIIESAQLDSGESLKLKYTLLPGFIANRLQGLRANQNAIQRTVFFQDGMKLFAQSPVLGNGMGSFSSAITGVQNFHYETKYVHNHYIQVLLEVGILGFLPFVGALLGMAFLLWKRRKDEEWEFCGEYPAMWGGFVMLLIHMAVEVSMSICIPLAFAFVLFALIIRSCSVYPEAVPASKGKGRAQQQKKEKLVRAGCAVLPAIFLITLCCNMAVKALYDRPVNSSDQFMKNLELGAKLDVYEGNDAKLSYVMAVYSQQLGKHVDQANRYAEELMEVRSNSIPGQLVIYYLSTSQYDQAMEAAKIGAKYSASSADAWNQNLTYFRRLFVEINPSPLLTGDTKTLTDDLIEYYQLLQQRNADSMDSIELSLNSKDFFSRMLYIDAASCEPVAVLNAVHNLYFDLATGCDADQDGIHDQIVGHSGARFSGSSISLQEKGSVELELREGELGTTAQITVSCDDPASITVFDTRESGGEVLPSSVQDGQAIFPIPMYQSDGKALNIEISSLTAQNISGITVVKAG